MNYLAKPREIFKRLNCVLNSKCLGIEYSLQVEWRIFNVGADIIGIWLRFFLSV